MLAQHDLGQELNQIYSRVSLQCKTYLQNDPLVTREDTCRGILALTDQLRKVLTTINAMKAEERARQYYVAFNAITYILDIVEHIRRTNFSFQILPILAEAIKTMEQNMILKDVKYLDRRTELYIKMARIYEQWQNYQEAVSLLDCGIKSYKEIKAIHEQDLPVPTYVLTILDNNLNLLKVFFIKYSIQAGSLAPVDWKKKVDEEFGESLEIKLMSLVEALRMETKKHSNIFTKNIKNYKEVLVQSGYEMVKPHLQTLSKGLTQQKEKIEREVTFKSTLSGTQQQINQEIKKRRQLEEKYVKESDIRKASQACPLEYHAELINFALQTKSTKIISQLIEHAKVRTQCRRIQVPYVNDVMIAVSNSAHPNIPNGYTKIPTDLNQANMTKELTKLRKSGKKPPQEEKPKEQVGVGAKQQKKEVKKGGKEGVAVVSKESKESEVSQEPTQWELNEIKHKFVFMMVKKSMSPEDAIYDLAVVLGNEEIGPVGYNDNRKVIVPYIQQNMKILESEVKQYTGVRQTTGLVPYIVLYHSRDGLQNEKERKTLLTDVVPLLGKNPMVPPQWGYNKIDLELRQVPIQFIKVPNHDYVYLCYKTDQLFHISERHIQVISAFVDLQGTYNYRKGGSNQHQKWMQLEVNYDLGKLNLLFETVQEGLRGELGQQYYKQKSDFLTTLVLDVWTKYLKNALLQLDYMRQQRLNGQIIDYDYECYKSILDQCNPVFLKGLKIMNIIMVNNPKSDILLEAKINLELSKLLEEGRHYRVAADNIKLCLAKLRNYRDQYLAKGVDGAADKLLPFAVTCSNTYIHQVIAEMRKSYHSQRRTIEKMLRVQQRKNSGQKPLSPEQLEEEVQEFTRHRKADDFDKVVEKVGSSHSQLYLLVSAIELDLLNLYFRISLKRSQEVSLLEQSKNDMTNGVKNRQLQGLASTLKNKLTLNQGLTQTKNIKNLSELQNTLVKANQLPTPMPKLEKMQAKLISQNKKNPYSMVLLMINLAAQNSQNKDKRYYLEEALMYLHECKNLQSLMMTKAIENAIFIFSGLWDNKVTEDEKNEQISPFKHLYSSVWQRESEVPEAPILLSKNSSSIHLKLPPFIPKKRSDKEQARKVGYMSVFGKASANGVDVSLNCVQLEGTGIRKLVGSTVKVSSLIPNNLYVFAAAGIDSHEESMGIGKTGSEIGTFNPYSIPMLASYLAKISYQINVYDIAQKAADLVLKEYCNLSNYSTDDERPDNLHYYSISEDRLKGSSLLQIKSVSESLYISALCHQKKLKDLQEDYGGVRPKIGFEERRRLVTNLLMLSACLTPSLHSPNMSIPFLIPEHQVLQRAMAINMIPDKWMNPRIRKLGVSVMSQLLKWGLENNQANLARRLVYRWNQRKYLLLGKMIQIEEKKELKKAAKQSKEQEIKMVDKYCRLMVEKTPYLMDAFEDSMVSISEEYYDYVNMFVERAKEQVSVLSQYVDNPPEQLDQIINSLLAKLQLVECMREPIQSIKKFPSTSPYYLEYNSKILKKALQIASESQYKTIAQKAQELEVPDVSEQIKLAKDIYDLIFTAIKADIGWTPSSKLELIQFQKNTGKDLSQAISIFSSWEQKKGQLMGKVSESVSLKSKHKDFDYLNMWMAELCQLKAQCLLLISCNEFEVRRPLKVRFDLIKNMSLDDLFKKEKELSVLEDKPYCYSEEQTKRLVQILSLLAQSIYSSLQISNWLKMQSTIKVLCNFLSYIQATPFYHPQGEIYSYFAFISLCIIEMLTNIKKRGFWQFKERYNSKLMNTEMATIQDKLLLQGFQPEPLVEPFTAQYYQPDLHSGTTKTFWFSSEPHLHIQPISSIIAYTLNTLRLYGKHQLVINIVRDFSNATQHYYSLMLLPFMANSQSKLLEDVEHMIQKQSEELLQVTNGFKAEKEKMGKKRAYLMSGEKMDFEKQFEEKSKKIEDSLCFLNNEKAYIQSQMSKSNRIKDEISRDTSKQVLAQEQQRKYTVQFGEHYESMVRQFSQEAKHVRKSTNFIKDIINKYDTIYKCLQNSKTSKDTLAEIQNRNEVGNLWFASANLEKAFQFWNDSLATIFKKVKPIENYHQIIQQNRPFLVTTVGEKEVVLAICLLYKISHFTCGQRLHMQKAAAHFACQLAYSLFETSLEFPQSYLGYKDFRIKSLPSGQVFSEEGTIRLTQFLSALEYFVLRNLYDENVLSALPLVALYQYVGTDVVKNTEISIKAKIYRAMLLSESGLISESIAYLSKVTYEKDLPLMWLQSSDFLKREKGMNWSAESNGYNNSQLWSSSENKGILEQFRKMNLKAQPNSILNPIFFSYAKALTLFKVYEGQMSKDEVMNELRLQGLNQVEAMMRQSLKKCGVVEEYYCLLEEYQVSCRVYKQNQADDDIKKKMDSSKVRMIEHLKQHGFEESVIKGMDREESSALKRCSRLQFMSRIRFTLHRIYEARNLLLNSYYVLKNGLNNIHRYAYGVRSCQTGFDPEIKTASIVSVTGKKDDKKGGKRQEEAPLAVTAPVIDWEKQKQTRELSQSKSHRTSLGVYWHIKMLFQMGKLLFRQNNFKESIRVFEMLIGTCKQYSEEYYHILSYGFLARARLRLGSFNPEEFKRVVAYLESLQFKDENYISLTMDLGELLTGQPAALEYLRKGQEAAESMWKRVGMKSVMNGIGVQSQSRRYYSKEEASAEQDELIRKKRRGEKKGGKEEKKGAKKEDPKKGKKEENKLEFKVSPLSQLTEATLLEEQKLVFGDYAVEPHPNYHRNNIYQSSASLFIKTYARVLSESIKVDGSQTLLSKVNYIAKLLQVLESYPYPLDHIKIILLACLGKIHKSAFLTELNSVLKGSRQNYLSLVKQPFEDLPLNASLINLPSYSQFLANHRPLLTTAKTYFRKCLSLVQSSSLLLERSFHIEEVAWQYADNQCLLAEYVGRQRPKFVSADQVESSLEDTKLQSLNAIVEAFGFLDFSIKMRSVKSEMERNYMQIGGKGLDPAAKLDEDISCQIAEMDRQYKKGYPQFLTENYKGRGPVTGAELMSYMLKAYRQGELMTFCNPSCQNTIYKCNRLLSKYLAGYRQRCQLASLEIPLRKSLQDKFLEPQTIICKSIREGAKEVFLYVVAPLTEHDQIYYGRMTMELTLLSTLTQDLLSLTTRTSVSDKKTQSVRDRDYLLHRHEFNRILNQLSAKFGNPKTDGVVKALPEECLPDLVADNLSTLNRSLDSSGFNGRSASISKFWRKLHQIKYRIENGS